MSILKKKIQFVNWCPQVDMNKTKSNLSKWSGNK